MVTKHDYNGCTGVYMCIYIYPTMNLILGSENLVQPQILAVLYGENNDERLGALCSDTPIFHNPETASEKSNPIQNSDDHLHFSRLFWVAITTDILYPQ